MRPAFTGTTFKNSFCCQYVFSASYFSIENTSIQLLPVFLVVILIWSNPVFASAYLCSDGIFRGEPVPELDCQEVQAVINREPAEIYIPASLNTASAKTSFFPFSISSDYPFLNFVEKKKQMPSFQKLPEFIQKRTGLPNSKHKENSLLDSVFQNIPHPINLLDCINEVLQQGANPTTCSQMIYKERVSDR